MTTLGAIAMRRADDNDRTRDPKSIRRARTSRGGAPVVGLLERLVSLAREAKATALPPKDPRAVYDEALAEKADDYGELRRAVAGVLYLKTKLEADVRERRAELARAHYELCGAVRAHDEARALELVERKHELAADLSAVERELDEVLADVGEAKHHLSSFRERMRALEREKLRASVTIAATRARERIEQTIDTDDSEDSALNEVREQIARITSERSLERELGGRFETSGPREAALIELAALKARLRR
jgi:phage shock protein A